MDKDRKKFLKEKYAKDQRDSFQTSLPLPIDVFTELFDFVNDRLEHNGCNHSLKNTIEYLSINEIEKEEVLAFMRDKGGYCDCEVIYNVEPMFEEL